MGDDFDIDLEWEGKTPDELEDEFGAVLDAAEKSQHAAMEALGLKAEADTKRNIVANGQVDTGNMLNSVESRTRRKARGEIETRVVVPANYAIYQEVLHAAFLRPAVEDNIPIAEELLGETLVDPFKDKL